MVHRLDVSESRTYWYGFHLGYVAEEPLLRSLVRYRPQSDRVERGPLDPTVNLISSRTPSGRQMPVLDLDVPHRYVSSTTEGHGHLYIDLPISRWRWRVLMVALRIARVHEVGYTAWSLRRGANFVRPYNVRKNPVDQPAVRYGWLFRLREPH